MWCRFEKPFVEQIACHLNMSVIVVYFHMNSKS
jgi:hypothetical protein